IFVVPQTSLLDVVFEISQDRLLPAVLGRYPGPERLHGVRFEAYQILFSVLQDGKSSALAYSASVRQDQLDPPVRRVVRSVESFFAGHKSSFMARPRDLVSSSQRSRSTRSYTSRRPSRTGGGPIR